MKISCNIIRDLLPLYAEDLASDDTRALVDEHLCDCTECTNILENMKQKTPVPVETTPDSLNKVKRIIRRKRILSVMAALLTLITIAFAVLTYLFTPFQLTKEQALDDFYVREDGAVVIDYSPYVTGRSQSGWNENWFINQYSTRYDIWKGENRKSLEETFGTDGVITEEERQRYENIDIIEGHWETPGGGYHSDESFAASLDSYVFAPESEKNWWYSDPTGMGKDILLHDAGQEKPEKTDRVHFSPVYPMIFFGGLLVTLVLLILRKFTKKFWIRELETRCMILTGSVVLSTLFVSNGRIFTSFVGVIDQYWGWFIGMDSVFLTLTILFWRQLHLLNKRDKAM